MAENEVKMQETWVAVKENKFSSIYGAARHFGVSNKTLARRASGGNSYTQAREITQLLSIAEEKALARWISQSSSIGHPTRHVSVKEMAEEIRSRRFLRVGSIPSHRPGLGQTIHSARSSAGNQNHAPN